MKKIFSILTGLLLLISPFQGNAEQFRKATLIHDLIGNKIVVSSKAEADKGFSLGYRLYDSKLLGYNVVTNYQTTLSASISSSQTTIPVSTVKTKDGHTLTMDDMGDYAYLSVDTGSLREEIVKCTGISGSSFTGCSRGLAFYGTSTDPVIANQYAHSAGSKVVMSNVHYVYQGFVDRQSDETIAGKKTFSELTTFNELPVSTTTAPTSNSQLVNKKYVDDTVVAGGVPGTEVLPGIFMLADKTQIENSTATSTYNGIDYNLVLGSNNVATSSQATTTIIATESDGKINQDFLDLSENFNFSGDVSVDGNFSGIEKYSFTAGENINVTSNPVPVFIASDGKIYRTSFLLPSTSKVDGFISTSVLSGVSANVQSTGQLSGENLSSAGDEVFASDEMFSTRLRNIYAYNIEVGYDSTKQKVAQLFSPNYDGNIKYLKLLIHRVGSPNDGVVAKIYASDKTTLLGTSEVLDYTSIPAQNNFSTYSVSTFTFTSSISILKGTNYYVVFERTGSDSTSNFYYIGRVNYSMYVTYGCFNVNSSNTYTTSAQPSFVISMTIFSDSVVLSNLAFGTNRVEIGKAVSSSITNLKSFQINTLKSSVYTPKYLAENSNSSINSTSYIRKQTLVYNGEEGVVTISYTMSNGNDRPGIAIIQQNSVDVASTATTHSVVNSVTYYFTIYAQKGDVFDLYAKYSGSSGGLPYAGNLTIYYEKFAPDNSVF